MSVDCKVTIVYNCGMSPFEITPIVLHREFALPGKVFDGQKWPMEYLGYSYRVLDNVLSVRVSVYFKPNYRQEIDIPSDDRFMKLIPGPLAVDALIEIFRRAQEAYSKARPDVEAW